MTSAEHPPAAAGTATGGPVSPGSALAPDAAMVLGIASTAMPFARTPTAEAERWLRILRQHGTTGVALQALGVSEGPLGQSSDRERAPAAVEDRDSVAQVTARAVLLAARRGAAAVATTDVLLAVMDVYGESFDRVLLAHGTDRDEVIARLGAGPSGPGEGDG